MGRAFRTAVSVVLIGMVGVGCSNSSSSTSDDSTPPSSVSAEVATFCDSYGKTIELVEGYEPGTGGDERDKVTDALDDTIAAAPVAIEADTKAAMNYMKANLDTTQQPDFDDVTGDVKESAVALYTYGVQQCAVGN